MTLSTTCNYCNQPYTFDPTVDRFGRSVPLPTTEANGHPATPIVHFPPCTHCGNRNKVPHPPAAS